MKHLILFSSIMLIVGACASTKPPNQELTQLEASIKQAEQVGAEDYAPLEIREARKKLEKVRDLMGKEKYKKAKLIADEAMADAELAQMKALSEKAQKAVNELRKSINALKQEIQNNLDKQGNQS